MTLRRRAGEGAQRLGATLRHVLGRAPREAEWVFVQPADTWIMNTICRRIAQEAGLDAIQAEFAVPMRWPEGRVYFFSHFAFYRYFLRSYPRPDRRHTFVLFTHWQYEEGDEGDVVRDLVRADGIFVAAEQWREWLVRRGVDRSRVTVVLAGCDADVFTEGRSREPVVGFSGGYQPRKGADRMFDLVEAMPDTSFILLGRHWERHPRFGDVSWRPNFRYVMTDYQRYPSVYHQMRALVSATRLDGGPMGVLEAMMCGVVPVASRVGFAPDLIRHGANGFLFDLDAPLEDVVGLVREALRFEGDVRGTVLHLSWREYARKIVERA